VVAIRKLLAAAALTAALLPGLAQAQIQADVVYRNGRIYTLDGKSRVVSAVAVWDGRFVAVGSDATVKPYLGPRSRVVDLRGAPAIPGLNDTHVHTVSAGEAAIRVKLLDTRTMAEAMARIKEAAATRKPGEWIIGETWHPTAQLAEKRFPTRQDLDAVAPDNPVALMEHISSFNSAALKLAGIDRNTPDPEGGVIERDANGEPTGVMQEKAGGLVSRFIPPPTPAELEQRYLGAMKVANAYGLTSVTDPGLQPANVQALQRLKQAGRLTLRYSVMFAPNALAGAEKWDELTRANGATSGFGDEWLKFDAIGEMPADGGMTFRTAYMRQPYPNDPNYRGVPALAFDRLKSNVSIGNRNGWRFSIHTVGDASIDQVLDAYAAADKERTIAGRRFAVMHGSLIQRDQLERMKRLGVILELQNIFMWDKAENVERNLGAAVANRAVPTRMAIDILGINNVSSGSDFQTNIMNPWVNLYVAVTRKDPRGHVYGADQAVTREEALRLYTVSGAYTSFEEKTKGPIETGKLADMVVLDRDYFTVPAEQIKDIQPAMTIVGGEVVYRR
jgi:predicted amidohydrolase YtcJ